MWRRALLLHDLSIIARCSRVTVVRNYAPRGRQVQLPENPGLDKRMRHFKDDIMHFENDPEMFDSLEPDFMNLNMTHREHEWQVVKMKDKNYRLMVGRKYFQTKTPNFLTFNEKEQIRDLHEREPDEWTIEKLSESFPADPHTISLILRAKWQPKDVKRIERHDESVIRNWESFKSGKLEVDPLLAEHLKKFALRDFDKLTEQKPNRKLGVTVPKPKRTEFLSIITSCKKKGDDADRTSDMAPQRVRKITSQEIRIPEEKPLGDNFVLEGRHEGEASKRSTTLRELQKKNPQLTIKETAPSEMMKFEEAPSLKVAKLKSEDKEIANYEKSAHKVLDALEIQPKIKIPKVLRQKDKIYQVKDCFYADDGEFLYRVPGFFRQ